MTTTAWSPSVGADLVAMLDDADVELERAHGILRARTVPVVAQSSPAAARGVLHAVALADEAEVACAQARARLAEVRSAVAFAAWSYTTSEQLASAAIETLGGVVATGLGTLVLGGLLLSVAALPANLPGILLAAGLAQTPVPDVLLDAAARVLAPLAPMLPDLLSDPAFVDALALAIESADEALAGLAGLGLAQPLEPLPSQRGADDEALSTGAGVALALALVATGHAPRLPGASPTRAAETATPPAVQPPIGSYGTAFERLSADGPAIEVQRYEHPDGSVVWQVLARGTESFAVDDPSTAYDLTANVENAANAAGRPLVGSAAAVEQALVAAGAQEGDVVQLFGYSQGGAAVAAAAAYGRFAVDTVVTFGAPIGATPVGDATTAVAVQHDSDLVAALGGRHGGDRIVIEASPDLDALTTTRYDPDGQPLADVAVGGHHPEAYADTAARLDVADDDLVEVAWVEVTAATDGALPTTATGFAVERPGQP
ncbi:hypothetical protein GCM10009846_29440 [Agrococcus versicolor]|uniref:Cutinase family protein n=1 Tax=Agrococcus versicolor TaxID=501482 RepID=A0ABP5MQD4_9MICO